jgi:sugar lactone lactonase YvrE
MSNLEHFLSVQNELGETPIWVPEEAALYWVDIGQHRVYRWDSTTGEYTSFKPDIPVRGLCRRASGGWLLIADTGLAFWDPSSDACEFIVNPFTDNPDVQFNDGMIDPQGRLFVGSYNAADLESPDGSFFRLDKDRSLHKLDDKLVVTNGVALSPDHKTMYLVEMFANRILAYDYDTTSGVAQNRRVFVDIPADDGMPDGLTTDSEGFVWAAHWGGWRVSRFDPAGKLEREIRVPAELVTCIGFGGKEMDELYITTAWFNFTEQQRKEQPQAGDLFRIQTDIKGIPEPGFAG